MNESKAQVKEEQDILYHRTENKSQEPQSIRNTLSPCNPLPTT